MESHHLSPRYHDFCRHSISLFWTFVGEMSGSIPDFPKLSDSNYKEWKTNMKSSLQALGVWRVVTGERSRPGPESGDLDKFLQDFDKAAGWLKMRVETSQMAHFEGFEVLSPGSPKSEIGAV